MDRSSSSLATLAEEALRLSETRLHLALRAGRMGTWELDLNRNELQCSNVFKANFGRTDDAPFTFADVEDTVDELDREAWRHAMAAVRTASELEGGATSSFELEMRVRWPDESVHWVYLRAEGARAGAQRLLSGIAILVDERKAIEETLRAADRQKDEFLATASHELRTPLNAILGWARLLRSGKLDSSATLQGIETIERNAIAQVRVIEDILDGSRIVTGKLRLELRPVDMSALVSAALDAIRPAAEAKQIELAVEVGAEAVRLSGDPDRLQQVVWNLANNAIKFTPKGGHVRVHLGHVGSHVELTVSDSGRGIPSTFLPHVFERFRQLDGGTTRRHGGLGLGLALVRHLAEAHGGSAHAESPGEGGGATFTVRLPIRAVHAEDPVAERREPRTENALPLAPGALDGVSVLVVDDEADARDLVATVLRASGAEVSVASGAEHALELLASWCPTLLVSDIGMPDIDGYELIRRVRSNLGTRGAELPAVALTAFAREEDRRLALAAGFHSHVAKPVEPVELVRLVDGLSRASHSETTKVVGVGVVRRADPLAKLERVLATQGIAAALRFLNDRTAHRFTGLYRFGDQTLMNLFLIDAESPAVEHGDDVPLRETYCSIVGETTRSFTTEDTRRDDRLRGHPARDSVVSYCGVLLRDAEGAPFGTLCHFDVCPSDVPVSEMPLLEIAAQSLMRALAGTGLV